MIDFVKGFFQDKMACLGLAIIGVVLLVGLLAPVLAPHDPLKVDLSRRLQEPGGDFLLGTDQLGRCILSRIIYGTQVSLKTSFLVVAIIMTLGILVGTLAGYLGGILDRIVVGVIDVLLAFPALILALALAGMLGPSLVNVMIALAAVYWVGYARIIRGIVVSLKEKEYVLAARSVGTKETAVIWKHVLPNMISPVMVLATLDMGTIILTISGLSFLGLGVQPPLPEWGAMLNDGRPFMQVAPWLMIFPGLAILITVLSFNLIGDGLRDIFDVRGVRSYKR